MIGSGRDRGRNLQTDVQLALPNRQPLPRRSDGLTLVVVLADPLDAN